jgi:hypothetical protein
MAFAEAVLLASGARTTTQTLDPVGTRVNEVGITGNALLLEVCVNLTAFTTAASLTPSIEFWDVGAGAWVSVLAGAALAANGTVILRVGPYQPVVANLTLGSIVWPRWRVVVTHGNANSHTYSVSARIVS